MNFSLLLSIETSYCYHYYCILIIVFIDRLRAAVDCYIRLQYVGFFIGRQSLVSGYIQYVLISVNRKFHCNHCIPIIVFIDSPQQPSFAILSCIQRKFFVLQRIVSCYQTKFIKSIASFTAQ